MAIMAQAGAEKPVIGCSVFWWTKRQGWKRRR
jgi:hypothetical protein